MLKKAGIVAAAATAAILAVSPLAFAGDKDHDGHHKGHHHAKEVNSNEAENSEGFVNVSGNNVNVPIQACHNQVPINAFGIQVPLSDLDGILDVTGALGLFSDDTKAVRKGDNTIDESCSQDGSAGDTVKQKIDD